jgi:hypothetical protein
MTTSTTVTSISEQSAAIASRNGRAAAGSPCQLTLRAHLASRECRLRTAAGGIAYHA